MGVTRTGKVQMILLDTNYILRFLIRDEEGSYKTAKSCIQNSICMVSNEVLAEVVFVLLKVYQIDKKEISDTLTIFIQYDNIIMDSKDIALEALCIFARKNIDFIDSILCAKSSNYEIKTFDKKLQKCIHDKTKT